MKNVLAVNLYDKREIEVFAANDIIKYFFPNVEYFCIGPLKYVKCLMLCKDNVVNIRDEYKYYHYYVNNKLYSSFYTNTMLELEKHKTLSIARKKRRGEQLSLF